MGTTAQKLQNIVDCKSAIQTAVRNSLSQWRIVLPNKLSDWADKLTNVRTVKLTGNISSYQYSYSFGSRNSTYYSNTKQPFADTITTVDLSEIGDVAEQGFTGAFIRCSALSNIIFPTQGLHATGSNAFNSIFGYCPSIEDVTIPIRFSDIINSFANMFQYCSNLKEATIDFKFDSCTYNNYLFVAMFRYCNKLEKFTMKGLKTLTYNNTTNSFFGTNTSNCFVGTGAINEIVINDLETFQIGINNTSAKSFGLLSSGSASEPVSTIRCPDLKTIQTNNFNNINSSFFVTTNSTSGTRIINNIYLPKLTQVSPYAFNFVTNCTFHFGAENRAAIEALTNYENHFSGYGGNTTTFVFDL